MKPGFRHGLIGAAGVLALVLALPLLVPSSIYKGEIEQSVTRATGRNFTVSGPLYFTLFPTFGLRADNITLANMPGGQAPSMVHAADVRVGVRLLPLLLGRIEVSQIQLDRPDIVLEVDKEGRANWTFERRAQSARNLRTPHLTIDAHFSGLSIAQGRVTYSNLHSGDTRKIDDLEAAIDLGTLDRPAVIAGTFTSSREHVAFRAEVATPHLIFQDRTAALDLSLASTLLQADFKGTLTPDGHVDGSLKIDTRSARDAAAWLGSRVPNSGGLGVLTLQSRIAADSKMVGLSNLKARLDGMNIAGDVSIATEGEVPFVKGTLAIDRLDINPYLERPRASPNRRSHRGSDEWSRDPIALDLLHKFDAVLRVNAGALTLRKLKLGKTSIDVALAGARLSASLYPLALYGGSGKATLEVDARGSPSFHDILEFDNVALRPFLSDTIGVKQIEGTGTIDLDVASTGASADAIMRGVNGKGSIHFRDGRIRGVDFGAVARTIQSLLGSAITPAAMTQYRTMDGSFAVAHGVLANRDFRLEGPLLSATGSGAVDVGNRAIDFRIEPKATASIAHEKLTIGVPFRVRGPWRHVHYTADVSDIVKGVIENLEAGRAPFKGMFGGAAKPDDKKKKHKSLGDALKNMLGIH